MKVPAVPSAGGLPVRRRTAWARRLAVPGRKGRSPTEERARSRSGRSRRLPGETAGRRGGRSGAVGGGTNGRGLGDGRAQAPGSGAPGAAAAVQAVGRHLLATLGPQGWWPADSAEEVVIGAVLTQAVSWDNATRAIAALKARGLCALAALAAAEPGDLAPLIRPAGYYNAKARKLVALARFCVQRGGLEALRQAEPAAARDELLAVYGVGPETADAILCYALGHPAFVADAYARRVLARIGLLPAAAAASYAAAARWAAAHVRGDPAWLGELHALLVAVGKAHCRRRAPRCTGCPARAFCAFARQSAQPAAGPAREAGPGRRGPRTVPPRPRSSRGGRRAAAGPPRSVRGHRPA